VKQRTFFKVLCVVLLLTLLIPSAGLTRAREGIETPTSDDYVTGELLVKFTSEVSPTAINGGVQTGIGSLDELIEEYDVRATEPLFSQVTDSKQGLENIYKMDLPETADVLAAAAVFGADAHVEYAEPNYIFNLAGTASRHLSPNASPSLPQTSCPPESCTAGRDVGRDYFVQVVERLDDVSMNGFAVDALMDWEPYENTSACWNPLATTWEMDVVCDFNSVGVQHYQDKEMGVQATANTLNLGYYDDIRRMLRLEAFDREGIRAALGTWGTCSGTGCDPLLNTWRDRWDAANADDPYFPYEWGLHNTGQSGGKEDADIDAPEAWEITTGVTETMIAVIDTGVDYNHEDLDDGRVRTDIDQDYVNDDDDAMDDHSHGTHVAGTIAGETNNGVGVAGVMWEAQILPLKVLSSRGRGSSDDVAAAIRYAADQDADAINMSLGSPNCSQTIADAINYAYDKDVVIVAASGNNGGSIGYPAKHAPVIAVGATDHNDHKAYFSNYGDELDVVAPGVSIFSTVPNNGYDAFSGTSMASPHVAGVVGLLLSQRPDLSNGQVREILRQSADDLGQGGFDTYYGYGRVNAHQALQAETPDEPPAPEDADCTSTGPCAAGVAVEGTEDGSSILSDLRAVRDEVFTEDPGQRWVDIYYEHQGEVAWLLATHKELRADALAGFRAFAPVFRAGLGEGPSVTLTPDLIEAAREALMGVAEHGSEEVHDDIVREWEKVDPYRFVGQDVLEVWDQLKQEERTMKVYLPLVMK
jgi:subtilisin family serine protease